MSGLTPLWLVGLWACAWWWFRPLLLGAEGDVPRAAVEAVGDSGRDSVLDVGRIDLVLKASLDAGEAVFQTLGERGLGLRDALESLGDRFPHDGDESVLEGGGESLGEEAGDGVVHVCGGCGGLCGGCRDDGDSLACFPLFRQGVCLEGCGAGERVGGGWVGVPVWAGVGVRVCYVN